MSLPRLTSRAQPLPTVSRLSNIHNIRTNYVRIAHRVCPPFSRILKVVRYPRLRALLKNAPVLAIHVSPTAAAKQTKKITCRTSTYGSLFPKRGYGSQGVHDRSWHATFLTLVDSHCICSALTLSTHPHCGGTKHLELVWFDFYSGLFRTSDRSSISSSWSRPFRADISLICRMI